MKKLEVEVVTVGSVGIESGRVEVALPSITDADLERVVAGWAGLSAADKTAIRQEEQARRQEGTRTVTGTRVGDYAVGWELTLRATAEPGYGFVGWSGAGIDDPTDMAVRRIAIDRDASVRGQFGLLQAIRTRVMTLPYGHVFPEDCGCGRVDVVVHGNVVTDGLIAEGSEATFTLKLNPGWRFTEWASTAGHSGTTDPLRVTIEQDMTVIANVIRRHVLTVEAAAGGTAGGGGEFDVGESASVWAEAYEGFLLSQWVVADEAGNVIETIHPTGASTTRGSRASGDRKTTTILVDQDKTVRAEFCEAGTDTSPEFFVDAATASFQVGMPGTEQLPQATGGNCTLTYSLDSIPAGLELNSATAEPFGHPHDSGDDDGDADRA